MNEGSRDKPIRAPEQSTEEAQREIIEEFGYFDDWMQRYQYIIDLGRKLPEFPHEWRCAACQLHGCQSQVWLKGETHGQRLHFRAMSDSAIVSGLISLLLRVYNDRTPEEILRTQPGFVAEIGLDKHLSPTRNNGLDSMIKAIQSHAVQAMTRAAEGDVGQTCDGGTP